MSAFPEYDATAGFPDAHIKAFKGVARQMKMVISSRELNPCCTDLVLEGYAAKGFHIKAKTCDWGPAAGFVVEDHRFIKGSTDFEKQKKAVAAAFGDEAVCIPIFLSDARFNQLKTRKIIQVVSSDATTQKVTAFSEKENRLYKFVLGKATEAPGGDGTMWVVYYDPSEKPEPSQSRKLIGLSLRLMAGLQPLMGMVNPHDATGEKGVKSAVAGDYDLWCVFPHAKVEDSGINDRPMQLRATLPKTASPVIVNLAVKAGVAFDTKNQGQKIGLSQKHENPDLGNFSLGIMKVKNALNSACTSAGYSGGNLVQHSDYGGNPFGDIDYPLIFFVPNTTFSDADVMVASQAEGLSKLKVILKEVDKRGFLVKLNPAWSVPNF